MKLRKPAPGTVVPGLRAHRGTVTVPAAGCGPAAPRRPGPAAAVCPTRSECPRSPGGSEPEPPADGVQAPSARFSPKVSR
eukprot:457369-Hanusia_phi.AAC.4